MELVELTNMCMIYDDKGRVLVEDRIKSWKGIAFPGGHLESHESVVDSVIREIKEETGLTISNLKLCGVKQWFGENCSHVCFLFKTNTFTGELKSSDEGNIFWIDKEKVKDMKLANTFEAMLDVFYSDELTEVYLDGIKDYKIILK